MQDPSHGSLRFMADVTSASRGSATAFVVVSTLAFGVVALRDVTSSNPLFHPHGYCYLWQAPLVWTHVGADLLIGLAYMTIPIALISMVRRAEGRLPFSGMLVAFGTFIVACGFTHFAEIMTLWQPWFWTAAAIKVVTAIASVATALAVPPLVPRVLGTIESARVAEERRVALEQAHDELEARVQARTLELTQSVARLEAEIAARERIEQQLKLREAQLQGILDHSTAYVYLKDRDCRFTLVNRCLADAYGGTSRFIGRANTEVFPADLAAEYEANDRRALAGETVQAIEHERLDDGIHTYLSAKFPVRDGAGEIVAIGGISTDVTDRERWREQRERMLATETELRLQAERNVREKDDFLAMLSHELRTPLNAVLGYLQILRTRSLPGERYSRVMDALDRNATALRRLVEDLLTVSGMVTGRLHVQLEPIDVRDALKAAVDTVGPEATRRDIRLHVDSGSAPLVVSGDSVRLQQVFSNLLGNAIKFSPVKSDVHMRASTEGDRIRVTVADQGQGIDPEFLPSVFEAFRQGDASTTREAGGLGLGLTIVQRLVAAHAGEVRAESAGTARGATFTVWLPSLS